VKAGNGAETERNLKSDHRDGVLTDKLCVISFFIGILCTFFFVTLVSAQNGSLCYYWGLLRWHRWLYNCVTVFCVFVQLRWTGYIFRHNGKLFLNNKLFFMLVHWVSHLHETSQLQWQSLKIPHSSFTVLWAVAYVEASCGSMWNQNLAPQVNCAFVKSLAFTWGRNIQAVGTTGFWKFIYTYICVCDSEQTVVILPMEHLYFPDQQG